MPERNRQTTGRDPAALKRPALFGKGNTGTAGVSRLSKAVHERVAQVDPQVLVQVVDLLHPPPARRVRRRRPSED